MGEVVGHHKASSGGESMAQCKVPEKDRSARGGGGVGGEMHLVQRVVGWWSVLMLLFLDVLLSLLQLFLLTVGVRPPALFQEAQQLLTIEVVKKAAKFLRHSRCKHPQRLDQLWRLVGGPPESLIRRPDKADRSYHSRDNSGSHSAGQRSGGKPDTMVHFYTDSTDSGESGPRSRDHFRPHNEQRPLPSAEAPQRTTVMDPSTPPQGRIEPIPRTPIERPPPSPSPQAVRIMTEVGYLAEKFVYEEVLLGGGYNSQDVDWVSTNGQRYATEVSPLLTAKEICGPLIRQQ